MKVDVKEVENAKLDGQYVWICDYRYSNIDEKPIRHVPPQRVFIRSNKEIKERVNYSLSHFVTLNSKGLYSSKIIKPYDNTGSRWYPGIPVNIFDNEVECLECYASQKDEILVRLENWKRSMDEKFLYMKEILGKS